MQLDNNTILIIILLTIIFVILMTKSNVDKFISVNNDKFSIILYDQWKYTGKRKKYEIGNNELSKKLTTKDLISGVTSIQLTPNTFVTLYSQDNFMGDSITLTASSTFLDKFNNKTKSLIFGVYDISNYNYKSPILLTNDDNMFIYTFQDKLIRVDAASVNKPINKSFFGWTINKCSGGHISLMNKGNYLTIDNGKLVLSKIPTTCWKIYNIGDRFVIRNINTGLYLSNLTVSSTPYKWMIN